MIIVWGKKRVERKIGWVADFCPICREVRAFQLIRIGMASHIYYISSGEGTLAGHVIRCSTCGVGLSVNPQRYAAVGKEARVELEHLVRETFPNLREAYAGRLALETQLQRSRASVPADEYRNFLSEPFALLNPQVEARFANSTTMDKQSGLGCLGTVLLGAAIVYAAFTFQHQGPARDNVFLAALVVCVLGTIYTFIQLHLGPGRFFRTKLLPSLVKALKPLEPTREDLTDCIAHLKRLGLKIGKVAKVDELWAALSGNFAGKELKEFVKP